MLNIVIGEDGEIVNDDFEKFDLTNNEIRYSKSTAFLDFVGFIVKKDSLLAVFPKHFFDDYDKNQNINENIKLLFNTIRKYDLINKTNDNEEKNKYIGHEENFESDYPFEPFYKIYEYYVEHGIFREEKEELIKGINGKISWKKTLQKSDVIISNGNLIYSPFFSKIKNHKYDFLSECMTFVINHTIENFSLFIDLKPITIQKESVDFLSNVDYTLRQLYLFKNGIFKDYQKRLIDSLIDFFEQYRKVKDGGAIHFKINYFNCVWEKLVENYLNKCFIGIDPTNRMLLFDDTFNNKEKKFGKEKPFKIDNSENHHTIQPDHYYSNEDLMYIFDSKYYEDLNDLNYKQFAYTLILGNSQLGANKKVYSALLLPGHQKMGFHLNLDLPYRQLNDGCNYIIEQYFDVKLLMNKYLNIA